MGWCPQPPADPLNWTKTKRQRRRVERRIKNNDRMEMEEEKMKINSWRLGDSKPASGRSPSPFSRPCCVRWERISQYAAEPGGVLGPRPSPRRSTLGCEGCCHGYGHLQSAPNWTSDSQGTWNEATGAENQSILCLKLNSLHARSRHQTKGCAEHRKSPASSKQLSVYQYSL